MEYHSKYTGAEVDALLGKVESGDVGGKVTVDSALSTTSENPVMNKVIAEELGKKLEGEVVGTTSPTEGTVGGAYDDTEIRQELTELSFVRGIKPKDFAPTAEKYGLVNFAECDVHVSSQRVMCYNIRVDYRDIIRVSKKGAYKFGIQYTKGKGTLYEVVLADTGWITNDSYEFHRTFIDINELYVRFNVEKQDGSAITLQEVIDNISLYIRNEEKEKLVEEIEGMKSEIETTIKSELYPSNSNNEPLFLEKKQESSNRVYYIGARVRYDNALHIKTNGNTSIKYSIQQCKAASTNYDYVISDSGWLQSSDYVQNFIDDKNIDALYFNIVVAKVDNSSITLDETLAFFESINLITALDLLKLQVDEIKNIHGISEYVAHRGVHINGIQENSLDAFIIAGRCGFDWAETDIQRTSDGHYVLMHDTTINRTMVNADNTEIATSVNVGNSTLAELRNYVFKSDVARFRTKIPTYEEYLQTCKKCGIKPLIELKRYNKEDLPYIIAKAREVMGENFAITAGYYSSDLVRSLDNRVQVWYLASYDEMMGNNQFTKEPRTKGNVVWYPSVSGQGLSKESVGLMHKNGVPVAVWIATPENIDTLVEMGVDVFAGDDLSPNLIYPQRITSDTDFSLFEHNGQEVDGRLHLSVGQYIMFTNANKGWLSGLKLLLEYKGSVSITGAHGYTINDSSSSFKTKLIQGFSIWGDVLFRVEAKEDTIINYISAEYEDL